MLTQLNNPLHYNNVSDDPTTKLFENVSRWAQNWFKKKQISQEIFEWVTDRVPKPGVAYGNVKTHKEGNPLRLITSCCGSAIERLSGFTEFYLKPLAQMLPSFLKDTNHLLQKIGDINKSGPLPPDTILVSWDVVAMFPNIDNNLGISAVTKYLDRRAAKYPSTDCIVEAVEICLKSNNSQFGEQHFVQKHGTAMGPKNACSYADLAMGVIDEKAKTQGPVAPKYWWRYRDDIIDIWPHGLPKLMEFTDFINSLYPTIRFELIYSHSNLNVLDITMHLQDGFIVTDVYAKPTDSHLYLPPDSSHPAHCKTAIPYNVALRLRRNCSEQHFFTKRSLEYKHYLRSQNYNHKLIDRQFRKASNLTRSDILMPKVKTALKKYPLVLDFNPRLPDIPKVLKKHLHLISASPILTDIFPKGSIIPAFRRTKNLKELIAPSKLRDNSIPMSTVTPGFSKCNKKCDLCLNYTQNTLTFCSTATGFSYKIKQSICCSSRNAIYLITCNLCHIQYVGSTSTQFKVRFRNHKSSMRTNKKTCEVAIHFNQSPHSLSDFNFLPFELITDTIDIDKKLLTREAYWTAQLHTLQPQGLNKRNELHSKNRIRYGV